MGCREPLTQRNTIDRCRCRCIPRGAPPALPHTRHHSHSRCIPQRVSNAKRKPDLNNVVTATNPADGPSALPPPKKRKANQTEFADAHRACKTAAEREQLALILQARWTEAELHEYARVYYFRNGKDFPTASSYRRAIADLGRYYKGMASPDAKPSDYRHGWLKEFRKGGSKPLPPRREALLKRGRGNGPEVTYEEYAWPHHTEEFRTLIEQRCRDYFENIPPDEPVHPNAWAASHRAYVREQDAKAKAERKATEAVTLVLSPKVLKKSKIKRPRRKIVSSYDSGTWYDTLKPHFNCEFPGHTPAFLEEVAALARKDKGKRPDAYVSPRQWKITCNKHYCLVERTNA